LKTRYNEAEAEIERLTKTVKIVEVEVREDTEPLRDEIQKLINEKIDLQQTIDVQASQINDQRSRIEQMEREKSAWLLEQDRFSS